MVAKKEVQRGSGEIIRPSQVPNVLGVCRTTAYRWIKKGLLPRPIRLGENAVGWRRSTLDAWLRERENNTQA